MAAGESSDDPFSASVWDSHRAVITELYQTKNMPLNQVMQYMASRHGFKPRLEHIYRLAMYKEND